MDNINNPFHYCHDDIECKDAMKAMMGELVGYSPMVFVWWAFTFKYLWRWPRKNGVEDLYKARNCINFLIQEVENEE